MATLFFGGALSAQQKSDPTPDPEPPAGLKIALGPVVGHVGTDHAILWL
ncbi:MAG: hypothetical protein HY719_12740, partial [Planctomycetes bacterium]|nr:hypothetical protein [Planctomycetota bacterium]